MWPILCRPRAATHGPAEPEGSSWPTLLAVGGAVAIGVWFGYERHAGAQEEAARKTSYGSVFRAPPGRIADYDFNPKSKR